ncbi:MAG: DUF1848 family protein [Promethearchaeota archaeon]
MPQRNLEGKLVEGAPKAFPVISCSRRTDIPAFFMDWLLDRVREGFVDVPNPFFKKQVTRVSLDPRDAPVWVWWSKNFGPWLEAFGDGGGLLGRYRGHYFQFTINGPSEVEMGVRVNLEERLHQVQRLVDAFGPKAVMWRFDPIVHWRDARTEHTRDNLDHFETIARRVADLGLREVTFSFATPYKKVVRRMERRGRPLVDPPLSRKLEVLRGLLEVCRANGLTMKSCCGPPEFIELEGVEPAHCVDGRLLSELYDIGLPVARDTGQREACGCTLSKDIGQYDGPFTCLHQCDYCYASRT